MIREIVVDIREGDSGERLLDAVTREMNLIALENDGMTELELGFQADTMRRFVEATTDPNDLPKFPGHVVINVFDENEELMEIIET